MLILFLIRTYMRFEGGYLVCDTIRGHMHSIARGHGVLHSLREELIGTAEHLSRVIKV